MLEEIAENVSHKQWRIVCIAPRCERLALQELLDNGFDSYCPQIQTNRFNATDYTPLFPGYIFVHEKTNEPEPLPVFALPHVYGWLNFGGTIPAIPDNIIQDISNRVREINADGGIWNKYEVGDIVTVTLYGTDSLGQVISVPKTYRKPIEILLNFMGREVRAKVSMDKISPFEENQEFTPKIIRRSRGAGRWTRQYRETRSANSLFT